MTTIREILESLPDADRERLLYAFKSNIPQHVSLPDGRYIGVHVESIKALTPEQTTDNGWSVGREAR